eukprot:31772-Pleurochrysis_carterae.AAC.5
MSKAISRLSSSAYQRGMKGSCSYSHRYAFQGTKHRWAKLAKRVARIQRHALTNIAWSSDNVLLYRGPARAGRNGLYQHSCDLRATNNNIQAKCTSGRQDVLAIYQRAGATPASAVRQVRTSGLSTLQAHKQTRCKCTKC